MSDKMKLPKAAAKRIAARLKPIKTTWTNAEAIPAGGVINHLGCSGGKDSTALILWALFESGYDPSTINISFCDTGNESPVTYEYLGYLEQRLGIRIVRIKPERDFFELSKWKRRFPSARARFCTEHLKVVPTNHYIQHLKKTASELVLHSGVRAAESEARSQLTPSAFDERFGCVIKRPLLTWKIDQVWAIHHKYGVRPNPLYAQGMVRVGCFPCVMSRKEEIRKIAKLYPEVINRLRDEEMAHDQRSAGRVDGTMFARDKVPMSQRTLKWTRKSDGKEFLLATIDDVVRWSKTTRGGKQTEMHFDDVVNYERLPMGETARSCPSSLGMCE